VVAWGHTRFPQAVVGLVPPAFDEPSTIASTTRHSAASTCPRSAATAWMRSAIGAEDVQLDLPVGGLLPTRTGRDPAKPGSVSMTASGPRSNPSTVVERVQPFGGGAGVVTQASTQPRERGGLVDRTEIDTAPGRSSTRRAAKQ